MSPSVETIGGNATLDWVMSQVPSAEPLLSRNMLIGHIFQEKARLENAKIRLDAGLRSTFVEDIRRRETFLLEAQGVAPDGSVLKESKSLSLYVPGLSLLAGSGASLNDAYLDGFVVDPVLFPHNGVNLNSAAYRHVTGLAWANGSLFFAEGADHTIRQIHPNGQVTNFMGHRGRPDQGGAYLDPRLNDPGSLGVLGHDLIILDRGTRTVKSVPLAGRDGNGQLPAVVLAGTLGQIDPAQGVAAAFDDLTGMAIHAGQGVIFLINSRKDLNRGGILMLKKNNATQRYEEAALIPTYAGITAYNQANPSSKLETCADWNPHGIAVDDAGAVYLTCGHAILKLTPGNPNDLFHSTWSADPFAGKGTAGVVHGSLAAAQFRYPDGLFARGQSLWVTDRLGVRRIAGGQVSPLAGSNREGWSDGAGGSFLRPSLVTPGAHDDTVFVVDQEQRALRRIITDPAGVGELLTLGVRQDANLGEMAADDAYAEGLSRFRKPMGVGTDSAGNVLVADADAACVFKVGPKGDAVVVMGRLNQKGVPTLNMGADPNGGEGFNQPTDLAVWRDNVWFVKDTGADGKENFWKTESGVLNNKGFDNPLRDFRFAPVPSQAGSVARTSFLFSGRYPNTSTGVWVGQRANSCETVVAGVEALALAMDADHRAYVLSAALPGQGLLLTRYRQSTDKNAPGWVALQSLPLFQDDQLDHLDCGQPEISHMTLDSKGNIYLADSGNGLIWLVPTTMDACEKVAGRYPELGGGTWDHDRGAHSHLLPFGGLATTAKDDLVFTSGRGLYQLTAPGTGNRPWEEARPWPVKKNFTLLGGAPAPQAAAGPAAAAPQAAPVAKPNLKDAITRSNGEKALEKFGLRIGPLAPDPALAAFFGRVDAKGTAIEPIEIVAVVPGSAADLSGHFTVGSIIHKIGQSKALRIDPGTGQPEALDPADVIALEPVTGMMDFFNQYKTYREDTKNIELVLWPRNQPAPAVPELAVRLKDGIPEKKPLALGVILDAFPRPR